MQLIMIWYNYLKKEIINGFRENIIDIKKPQMIIKILTKTNNIELCDDAYRQQLFRRC